MSTPADEPPPRPTYPPTNAAGSGFWSKVTDKHLAVTILATAVISLLSVFMTWIKAFLAQLSGTDVDEGVAVIVLSLLVPVLLYVWSRTRKPRYLMAGAIGATLAFLLVLEFIIRFQAVKADAISDAEGLGQLVVASLSLGAGVFVAFLATLVMTLASWLLFRRSKRP